MCASLQSAAHLCFALGPRRPLHLSVPCAFTNTGITMVGWCCMCQCSGETVSHLLWHCDVASMLWSRALGAFGVQWVIPAAVADLLFGWWNWLGKHSSDIWNIVHLCLMWILWWKRNQRTFEGKERSTDELETIFFRRRTLFYCSRVWGFTHIILFWILFHLYMFLYNSFVLLEIFCLPLNINFPFSIKYH